MRVRAISAKGEKVWVYNPAKTKGISPKLQSVGKDHVKFWKKLSDANYVIKWPWATKTKVVHFDWLKPCYTRTVDNDDKNTPVLDSTEDAPCDTFSRQALSQVKMCQWQARQMAATWRDEETTSVQYIRKIMGIQRQANALSARVWKPKPWNHCQQTQVKVRHSRHNLTGCLTTCLTTLINQTDQND